MSFYRLNDSGTFGFELVTCGFELVTRGFELVTRKVELVTREFELFGLNFFEFQLVTRNSCFTISLQIPQITSQVHPKYILRSPFL